MKKFYKFIKLFIALGLGIVIIWLSLKELSANEKNEIVESFKIANYWWVVLSIILGLISHIVRAARWRILLKPMGYDISMKNSFLAVMVGYFANLGIPRSGEVARCSILYKEEKVPVNKGFGTVILERSIDLIIFFLLFFITLSFEYKRIQEYVDTKIVSNLSDKFEFLNTNNFFGLLILGIILFTAIVFLIFRKKIIKSKAWIYIVNVLKGFGSGIASIAKIKRPFLFIAYTVLIWLLYYNMVYLCFYSLEATSDLGVWSGMSVLVLGTIGIMVTPGGIGLYPLIVMQTLALYGISNSTGMAMGWITWSAQTLMIIVFGSISLFIVSLKTNTDGLLKGEIPE